MTSAFSVIGKAMITTTVETDYFGQKCHCAGKGDDEFDPCGDCFGTGFTGSLCPACGVDLPCEMAQPGAWACSSCNATWTVTDPERRLCSTQPAPDVERQSHDTDELQRLRTELAVSRQLVQRARAFAKLYATCRYCHRWNQGKFCGNCMACQMVEFAADIDQAELDRHRTLATPEPRSIAETMSRAALRRLRED